MKVKFNIYVRVVMSFPAEGVEATVKNHIDDVRTFLDMHHDKCYAVYNCSQRLYRAAKFQNRVSTLLLLTYKFSQRLYRAVREKGRRYGEGGRYKY